MNLELVDEKDIPQRLRISKGKWTELRAALRQMPDDATKWIRLSAAEQSPKLMANRVRMALASGSESFRLQIIVGEDCIYVRKRIAGIDYPAMEKL